MHKDIKETDMENKKKKNLPDETSGIYVTGHIKIFDPETKEVFVNKREDG